ncbi:MAG: SRPBCC family protein [Erythrobacter sp.]|nr:SRPBCC family protein [Erythrobacter sp.]
MKQDQTVGAVGIAAGLAIVAGGVAAGRFFDRRRKSGYDDAPEPTRRRQNSDHALVGRTVTIAKGRDELYRFWHDFGNLAQFMENVEAVRRDGDIDVWTIKAPAGATVDLRTKVSEAVKGEMIAWRSVAGSDVETQGEIRFADAPGDRGTRVTLRMSYDPPAGAVGKIMAAAFMREPEIQARHDLKRLKMLMETGEIATSARRSEETRQAKQQEKAT